MKIASFMLLLIACAGPSLSTRRVAFDLQCDESQIRYLDLDDGVIGAAGCGKQATYAKTCGVSGVVHTQYSSVPVKKCSWQLQSLDNQR